MKLSKSTSKDMSIKEDFMRHSRQSRSWGKETSHMLMPLIEIQVYLVEDKISGEKYAVKAFNKESTYSQKNGKVISPHCLRNHLLMRLRS